MVPPAFREFSRMFWSTSVKSAVPEMTMPKLHTAGQPDNTRKHPQAQGPAPHRDQEPPVCTKARRLPPEKLNIAKSEFKTMLELGIIQRSSSPFSLPLHVAPKPGGGWRPCGDYRRLNGISEDDSYPVPRIHDFTANLAGRHVFSMQG